MAIVFPNPLIPQIAEALGLNPRNVRSLRLNVSIDECVTADVCEYVDETSLDSVIKLFANRKYVLVPGWVSVTERLPPHDRGVLLTDGEEVVSAWFDAVDGNWEAPQASENWRGAKAWMPLPEPPEVK